VPLFGNALQLDQPRLHIQLHEWAKEYGPVMKIAIFTKPIVLVNTMKAINEALITKGRCIQRVAEIGADFSCLFSSLADSFQASDQGQRVGAKLRLSQHHRPSRFRNARGPIHRVASLCG